MKQKKGKPSPKIISLSQKNSSTGLEELRQSHSVLQALIALVPAGIRSEFVELLQSLAEDGKSPESSDSERRRALQIVEEICRQEPPVGQTARYELERRAGDRRRGDRRQPNNFGRPWTLEQLQTLETLANQNTPIRRIALRLGRTSTAIQSKAREIDLPLKLIS
ncbi:hypothetical protein [Nitrosovibrio tenuis]|uniref:Uncharacterized protein n=1 Tax=Nitrosovibrio tenuis TaxID=1233 RepID=A0A1H7P1P1_9PROT|nr:hypothetical protein [Nitrosovibrio tenuis]SEL29238.1 hypothetical protein SAMN05216387_10812 [Nitrosovibrio tenuis]